MFVLNRDESKKKYDLFLLNDCLYEKGEEKKKINYRQKRIYVSHKRTNK